jgi:hypothetical protein
MARSTQSVEMHPIERDSYALTTVLGALKRVRGRGTPAPKAGESHTVHTVVPVVPETGFSIEEKPGDVVRLGYTSAPGRQLVIGMQDGTVTEVWGDGKPFVAKGDIHDLGSRAAGRYLKSGAQAMVNEVVAAALAQLPEDERPGTVRPGNGVVEVVRTDMLATEPQDHPEPPESLRIA